MLTAWTSEVMYMTQDCASPPISSTVNLSFRHFVLNKCKLDLFQYSDLRCNLSCVITVVTVYIPLSTKMHLSTEKDQRKRLSAEFRGCAHRPALVRLLGYIDGNSVRILRFYL